MRIIKFRIWCKVSKQYHYNWTKHVEQTDDDLLVWEQFTGLKDKEGREIYEHDIVKFNSGGAFEKPFLSIITFEIGCFGYADRTNEKETRFFNLSRWPSVQGYSIEVVGNIHETPNPLN